MRNPSARVLNNICQIYQSLAGRDNDGGVQFPYSSTPTYANVPCSTQPIYATEDIGNQRITQVTSWKILLNETSSGVQVAVSPRDKITFYDPQGTLRTVYVDAPRDLAGRNSVNSITASERI